MDTHSDVGVGEIMTHRTKCCVLVSGVSHLSVGAWTHSDVGDGETVTHRTKCCVLVSCISHLSVGVCTHTMLCVLERW